MRILFAQLCALFLFAITTVAIGAPIENTNTSMVTHLDKRETFPVCNAPYTKLRSASCYGWSRMYVTCVVPRQPSVARSDLQPCKPNERCVPFSYYDPVGFNLVQNAKCVPDKKRTRDWRSDEEHPHKKVCSQRVSYIISGENAHIATGVGTYSPFGNTANVDEIEVYRDGKLYDSITNKCNLSSLITNYNGEPIQYCFTANSVTVVVGIAAATQGDGDN